MNNPPDHMFHARRTVVWSELARRDLQGIRAYIGLFKPLAAQRFAARLVSAVEGLAEHPDRGRPVGSLRELAVISPYVIRYRVTADAVEIVRIKHAAQRAE